MRKKRISLILVLIALIIFAAIGLKVRNSSEGILFDMALLELIHNNTNPILLSIMKFISFIGSGWFLFPGIGIVIIYTTIKKKYYISKLLLVNTLGSFAFNYILKQIFQRTRPVEFFLVEQGGLSYPSGHSMVTMSMYLAIAYLISRNSDLIKKKKSYTIVAIVIGLMGLSRMYLGVHWPTDIIGGYLMGYIFYYFSFKLVKE